MIFDEEYSVFLWWRGHRSWERVSCLPFFAANLSSTKVTTGGGEEGKPSTEVPLSPDTCCWLAAEMEDTIWLCLRASVCVGLCVFAQHVNGWQIVIGGFLRQPFAFLADEGRSALWALWVFACQTRGTDTSRFWVDRETIHVSIISSWMYLLYFTPYCTLPHGHSNEYLGFFPVGVSVRDWPRNCWKGRAKHLIPGFCNIVGILISTWSQNQIWLIHNKKKCLFLLFNWHQQQHFNTLHVCVYLVSCPNCENKILALSNL